MIMRPPWWRTSIELGNTRLGRVHLHAFAILYEITRCFMRLWFHLCGIARECRTKRHRR